MSQIIGVARVDRAAPIAFMGDVGALRAGTY
jgi:hypothetical protein